LPCVAGSNCHAAAKRAGTRQDGRVNRAKATTPPTSHGDLISARSIARRSRGSIGDRSPFARNVGRAFDVEAHGEPDRARELVSGADIMPRVYGSKFE